MWGHVDRPLLFSLCACWWRRNCLWFRWDKTVRKVFQQMAESRSLYRFVSMGASPVRSLETLLWFLPERSGQSSLSVMESKFRTSHLVQPLIWMISRPVTWTWSNNFTHSYISRSTLKCICRNIQETWYQKFSTAKVILSTRPTVFSGLCINDKPHPASKRCPKVLLQFWPSELSICIYSIY